MSYPFVTNPSTGFSSAELRASSASPKVVTAGIEDNYSAVNNATMQVSHGTQISAIQNFVNSTYLGRETVPVISGFINNLITNSIILENSNYDVALTASGLCFKRLPTGYNLCYKHDGIFDSENAGSYTLSISRPQTYFNNTRLDITSLNYINMTSSTDLTAKSTSGNTNISAAGRVNISGNAPVTITAKSAPIYLNTTNSSPIYMNSPDAPIHMSTTSAPVIVSGLGLYVYGDTLLQDTEIKPGYSIVPQTENTNNIGATNLNFSKVYCFATGDINSNPISATEGYIVFTESSTGVDDYTSTFITRGATTSSHGILLDADGEIRLDADVEIVLNSESIVIGTATSDVYVDGNLHAAISAASNAIFDDIQVKNRMRVGPNAPSGIYFDNGATKSSTIKRIESGSNVGLNITSTDTMFIKSNTSGVNISGVVVNVDGEIVSVKSHTDLYLDSDMTTHINTDRFTVYSDDIDITTRESRTGNIDITASNGTNISSKNTDITSTEVTSIHGDDEVLIDSLTTGQINIKTRADFGPLFTTDPGDITMYATNDISLVPTKDIYIGCPGDGSPYDSYSGNVLIRTPGHIHPSSQIQPNDIRILGGGSGLFWAKDSLNLKALNGPSILSSTENVVKITSTESNGTANIDVSGDNGISLTYVNDFRHNTEITMDTDIRLLCKENNRHVIIETDGQTFIGYPRTITGLSANGIPDGTYLMFNS